MQIICKNDMEFPELLKKEKPIVEKLYVQGNVQNLQLPTIAIVGSRECSPYGIKVAYEFAYQLAKAGLCIASGMAIGIDKYAHLGALDANGKTIAVLGSGFQHIFPEENIGLYHRIIAENGTVITEYEPQVISNSNHFPKRNRIISGISLGVLVVEAEYRSGASITAQYARKQEKPLFCIPSNIDSSKGIGTNRLIKEGAKLVTSVSDILEQMNIKEQNKEIPLEYKEIYEVIKKGTHQINAICKKLNQNPSKIMSILTIMEIDGYVQSITGQEFIAL